MEGEIWGSEGTDVGCLYIFILMSLLPLNIFFNISVFFIASLYVHIWACDCRHPQRPKRGCWILVAGATGIVSSPP